MFGVFSLSFHPRQAQRRPYNPKGRPGMTWFLARSRHARLGNPTTILCLSHKDIHASRCTNKALLQDLSSQVSNAHHRDDCRLGFPQRFGRF